MKLAKWLGRRIAELTMLLRDKPMVPCQVDWDYRGHFVDVLNPIDLLDDQDISVDTLGEWGIHPLPPRQGWPCE